MTAEDKFKYYAIFGDKTFIATKNFQKKCGITTDGIVGLTTIAKAKEYKK